MNYYIADLHFGHEKVIRMDGRPFGSREEMDRCMISRWNESVRPDDDVYIVGDFCIGAPRHAMEYLGRLNGRKHLVVGHHDRNIAEDPQVRAEFVSVGQIMEIRDADETVVLCHYPLVQWNRYFRGAWHIHGHVHNRRNEGYDYFLQNEERALNAGCMVNHYRPVTLAQLRKNNREFREDRAYLWERYGKRRGPVELENGTWILPETNLFTGEKTMEKGDAHFILSEYCGKGLVYHFHCCGIRTRGYTFEEVLRTAFDFGEDFRIEEEDLREYSAQELDFLEGLKERLRKERAGA